MADCGIVSESIRSGDVLVPFECGGGEIPVTINKRNWLLPRISCT